MVLGISKQYQFNSAMFLYEHRPFYKLFNHIIAISIISIQAQLVYKSFLNTVGFAANTLIFVFAYIATDFINGVVHLIMDHVDHYESFFGPFIAQFHLHHKVPSYKKRNLFFVYYLETGSKIWLSAFLIGVFAINTHAAINPYLLRLLTYFAVLSSLAEVSHYLSHASDGFMAGLSAKMGVTLSKEHHNNHHQYDNTHYAFLNGCTNPLLNWIAKKYFGGYKNNTDSHYREYDLLNAR